MRGHGGVCGQVGDGTRTRCRVGALSSMARQARQLLRLLPTHIDASCISQLGLLHSTTTTLAFVVVSRKVPHTMVTKPLASVNSCGLTCREDRWQAGFSLHCRPLGTCPPCCPTNPCPPHLCDGLLLPRHSGRAGWLLCCRTHHHHSLHLYSTQPTSAAPV